MADVTWRTETEILEAKGVPALLVTIDVPGHHRCYFAAAGDPWQLAQCCAVVLSLVKHNPGLWPMVKEVLERNEGTEEIRGPRPDEPEHDYPKERR